MLCGLRPVLNNPSRPVERDCGLSKGWGRHGQRCQDGSNRGNFSKVISSQFATNWHGSERFCSDRGRTSVHCSSMGRLGSLGFVGDAPVPASHYIHPEFGFFCPTPRFRRRLRVALACLVVAGVGAAVMATADRPPKLAPPVTRADEPSLAPFAAVVPRLPIVAGTQTTADKPSCVGDTRTEGNCVSVKLRKPRMVWVERRAASMRRFSLPPLAPKATRRRRARQRSQPRARRRRRTLLLGPRTRKRRSRRAVSTIAATSTGMALRPGARSGSTIGQRAVTRQGNETTSGAHTVAGASRPISGKAGGVRLLGQIGPRAPNLSHSVTANALQPVAHRVSGMRMISTCSLARPWSAAS